MNATHIQLACLAATALFAPMASAARPGTVAPAPSSGSAPAIGQEEEAFFVRAGAEGGRVLNFQDDNASVVRRVDAGTLMRVRKTDVGFHNVEVAGGLQVWVHGKFLVPTDEPDVLRCEAWGVLMRPGPSSTVENMPITVKLQSGDLVRKIKLADPSQPMDKTWVQVWSPPHARGWVRASSCVPVDDKAAAQAEWSRSLERSAGGASSPATTAKSTPSSTQPAASQAGAGVSTAPAPTATGQADADAAQVALTEANRLYETAQAAESGYAPVVAAYEKVLATAAVGSSVHGHAEQRLKEAKLRHEIELLEAEAERQQQAEAKRLEDLRRQQEAQNLKETEHWGRFAGRGWVSATGKGEDRRYMLHWNGEIVAEVRCSTGRYDLDVFRDCEIGLQGVILRAAMPAREATFNREAMAAEPKVLDITKIEVISARN